MKQGEVVFLGISSDRNFGRIMMVISDPKKQKIRAVAHSVTVGKYLRSIRTNDKSIERVARRRMSRVIRWPMFRLPFLMRNIIYNSG